MHFSISVFGSIAVFTDVILPCYFALRSLGWNCIIQRKKFSKNTTNIIFGAHTINSDIEFPKDAILYNFEQLSSPYFTDSYIHRIQGASSVWDFNLTNVQAFKEQFGVEALHVFPGYVPEMTCLLPASDKKIDALFYGTESKRRMAILEAIRLKGMEPVFIQATGAQRDMYIAMSEIVLNIHSYLPADLEIARLGFLWANSKLVLSEDCPERKIPEGLEDACLYVPYEKLPETALMLHKRQSLREGIARRGFEAYKAKPLDRILEKIVGRPVTAMPKNLVPLTLNVGSGKDFMPHCLNIDINSHCKPDIVLDMSQPLDFEILYTTQRFGEISLKKGYFQKIVVHDVLEHVIKLPSMMENFLELLEIDGELDIIVPYDMAYGAWQDPTHIRAFNEFSWRYYCEWHWYLGWRDYCFDCIEQNYLFSDLGKKLLKEGNPVDTVVNTPRSVNSLSVTLRKRATTENEKNNFDNIYRSVYKAEVGGWRC